ncbi:7TM diverse intracellular signaling domain-containing protein [Pedobacter nyackensis]|uniref:7TM diverse intracellular signaling domain-containing protein n=1 Tax=Pedobacter nyackensis TaxID=475255 RepID=UPI00292F746D|nr:7TM diverse intracellular signaling domain-containing protein [Pedobacter nyackensis]
MPISIRYLIWITLFSLPLICQGHPPWLAKGDLKKTIALKPFFYAIEDPRNSYHTLSLTQQKANFVPLNQFHLSAPDHTFWLKTALNTSDDLDQTHFCLSFDHLTFVDLYIFEAGKLKVHRRAGAFRKKTDIEPEDNRFNFNFVLSPGSTYQLLLKVKHTKKFPPNFDFVLQSTYTYLSYNRTFDLINFWLQGAIAILFFYAGLSWFINRYRPFIWVMFFILGIGLYCFSLQPSFIDFFFPMQPETGWLLVPVFLHLGIVSFYLLLIDFLEIKKNAYKLYRYGHYIIKSLLIFSMLCVIHNSLTSNYYLTNQINLSFSIVHLTYISYISIVLWRKLDASQRFMIYGILVFAMGAIALVGSGFLFNERGLVYAPIISKTTILLIIILFLTGINQKLRQHEREKIAALEQLNKIHKEHNSLIERKVEERTAELRNMNGKLRKQRAELIEKKGHIDTLMDELNHRVKNNLQMLYSLSTLQLPLMHNEKSKQVLNDMRGRIKAMMLVNTHLNINKEKQTIQLILLVQEIKQHVQHIYDPLKRIQIEVDVCRDLLLHANTSLPFGLILTELFTNTFKHAFTPDEVYPFIKLLIHLKEGQIHFTYKDNGKGLEKLNTNSSMGISLIQDLIRQLKGNLLIDHHTGFTYLFTFPNLP